MESSKIQQVPYPLVKSVQKVTGFILVFAELVDHRQKCRFSPSFFIGDRVVGMHAGSSGIGAHEVKILCDGRVIVNNIVGLRTRVRAF